MAMNQQDPAEGLLAACSAGNLDQVQMLLNDPLMIMTALMYQKRPYYGHYDLMRSFLNLRVMVERAARSGHASITEHLLAFGHQHNVSYDTLITRDAIVAALHSNNVEVFRKFVDVMPECVNLDMSLSGDPLCQAVMGSNRTPVYRNDRVEMVAFLLEKGANPNHKPCQEHNGPGHHLWLAARCASLKITDLLLQHGARVTQSGAVHKAAEKGRLDVLEALLKHGANLDERLDPDVGFIERRHQRASETPLHVAVGNRQSDVAAWLLDHGVDANIKDAQGRTTFDVASSSDNEVLQDVFRRYFANKAERA